MVAWTSTVAVSLLLCGAKAPEEGRPARERADVQDVFATPDGQYIVLLRTRAEPHRYLPIAIGESEAVALRLRLDRRSPPRPLTLNLLESALAAGKIAVIEIAIDDHRDGIFIGHIRLRQAGRSWNLDARPSDALGLAAGKGVPIWVSRRVLASAGVDPRELVGQDEQPSREEASTLEDTL